MADTLIGFPLPPVFDQIKAMNDVLLYVSGQISDNGSLKETVVKDTIDCKTTEIVCDVHMRFSERSAATVVEYLREIGWTNTGYNLKKEKLHIMLAVALAS